MSADRFSTSNRSPRCLAIDAQLFDYVDSVLSAEQKQAVDAHLAGCEQCRIELEHIRRAESALASAPLAIPAPGSLYAGFANKLAARQSKAPPLRLRYVVPAFALAALAIILFRPAHPGSTNRPGIRDSALSSPPPTMLAMTTQTNSRANHARILGSRTVRGIHAAAGNHVPMSHAYFGMARQGRKRSGERRIDLELVRLGERRVNRKAAAWEVVRSAVNGVELADNLLQLEAESAETRQDDYSLAYELDVAKSRPGANNFMYYDTLGEDRMAALGVQPRGYLAPVADNANDVGFALLVQDDVRGFTAEAHNTESSGLQPSLGRVSADDGIKVEVEFDDAAGTTSF